MINVLYAIDSLIPGLSLLFMVFGVAIALCLGWGLNILWGQVLKYLDAVKKDIALIRDFANYNRTLIINLQKKTKISRQMKKRPQKKNGVDKG